MSESKFDYENVPEIVEEIQIIRECVKCGHKDMKFVEVGEWLKNTSPDSPYYIIHARHSDPEDNKGDNNED
jgi:hypothetical protein